MGRDDSYTEYVELRWASLSRLATLLVGGTAGNPDADDLTRAALLRAYRSWPDVLESGSRDAVVKQYLLDALVASIRKDRQAAPVRVPAYPGGPGDGEVLWSRFLGLPAYERAVLVLRCYEAVPEPEVADGLGLSTEATAKYADSALARLRDPGLLGEDPLAVTPEDVADELHRRAADALPPLPPVDALLTAGRAARRRRTRRGLAIAATVTAALLGTSAVVAATRPAPEPSDRLSGQPGLPSRMAQVPVGTPPRAPYAAGRTLDFGPAEVQLPDAPTAVTKAGSDLVLTYADGRLELFDSATTSRTVLTENAVGRPVVDTDGTWVAWQQADPGRVVVSAVSLTRGNRLEKAFPPGADCCDGTFGIAGITRAGQLVAANAGTDQTWVWDLGRPGEVARVQNLTGQFVTQVTADVVAVADLTAPTDRVTVGSIAGSTFQILFSTDRHQPDFSVPGWILYDAWDGTMRARSLPWAPRSAAGNNEVVLRLPPNLVRLGLRRELGTTVVMDVRSPDERGTASGYLVRCDIATGSCQNVAHLVGEHHLAE